MGERINSYRELRVYQSAMEAAMKIFQLTKTFPHEEKYSMIYGFEMKQREPMQKTAEIAK